MSTPQAIEEKFWKALKSDMTCMLGMQGVEDCHTKPMTAQVEGDHGPLWFFTAKDTDLVRSLETPGRAICTFVSKGNDLFASVHGTIRLDTDRSVVDRLWNPFVAAWYEGKDDPQLALVRLDPESAEVWLDASSLLAGIKLLLGVEPKTNYRDNVATVDLR